jgi:hypothetical protein
MNTLASNRQQALDWVNAVRTEWGLAPLADLKPGCANSVEGCALGRSLAGRAQFFNTGLVTLGAEPVSVLPDAVATFEHDFERGHYPDLLLNTPSSYYTSGRVWRPTAVDAS